ncbi:MAG TPA: hypothetical protein VGS57_03960, partial [Thermoanaerobaculia bacterium]|nr:hypothetical protein [Thermoanaerobaculia bacterium]
MAVDGKLFRSTDGWASWSRIGGQLPTSYLSWVAVSPQNANLVYFAIWEGGGLFRSSDGGETWVRVSGDLPADLVSDVVVPAGPGGTVFVSVSGQGIFRSRDQGETWVNVTPSDRDVNFSRPLPHPQRAELLVTSSQTSLWRTDDGGDTWRPWNSGLPVTSDGSLLGPVQITFAPGAQDLAFAVSFRVLYRSLGGGPWTRVAAIPVTDSSQIHAIAAGPGSAPVLLAGQSAERS